MMSNIGAVYFVVTISSAVFLAGCPSFLTHSTQSLCAHVQVDDVPGLEGTFQHFETSDEEGITIQLTRQSKGEYRADLVGPAGQERFVVRTCKLYGVWTAEVELEERLWGQLPLELDDDGDVSTPRLEQGSSYQPVVDASGLTGFTRSVSFIDQYDTYVVNNGTKQVSQRLAYLIAEAPRDLRWTRKEVSKQEREADAADDEKATPNSADRRQLAAACSAGKGEACTALARVHLDGLGAERDIDKSASLLAQACEHGDSNGCLMLGGLGGVLVSGQAGDSRRTMGLELLEASCEAGQGTACILAGIVYECETGEQSSCEVLSKSFENQYKPGFLLQSQADAAFRRACELGQKAGCDR